jgi:hypothetical protein
MAAFGGHGAPRQHQRGILGDCIFPQLPQTPDSPNGRIDEPGNYRSPFIAEKQYAGSKGGDFLDILRAKGLPERNIIKHATRNALLPLVTYVAVMTGLLFQGQVLLEIIFSWPGIGREIVTALKDLDYPVGQAAFFLMSLTILVMNFVAELFYGLINPRVTYD